MCGRYFVDIEFEELMQRYNIYSEVDKINSRIGEVFPSNTVPVIVNDGSFNQVQMMSWGFDFTFMKKLLINARSETAHEKKSFRHSFYNKRCLIPNNGFFEWKDTGEGKVKYKIELNEKISSFAGLYQDFIIDGVNTRSYVILTKEAGGQMGEIHHRIPVYVDRLDEEVWLSKQVKNLSSLQSLMKKPDRGLLIEKV